MTLRIPGMAVLLATLMPGFVSFSLLMPVSPLWASQGGADAFGSGLVTTTLMATTIMTQLLVSKLLRKLGWGWVLQLSLILLGVPAMLQALSSELWVILGTTALRGIGFGIITVCGATAVSYLAPPGGQGKAFGMYGLSVALPQVVFMPLAPAFVEWMGVPVTIFLGGLSLVGLFGGFRSGAAVEAAIAAASPAETAQKTGAGRRASRFAPLWPILIPVLTLVVITAAGGAIITFGPQITVPKQLSVALLLVFNIMSAFMRWYGGRLTDQVGARRLMVPLLILGGLGLAAIGYAIVVGATDLGTHRVLMLAGGIAVGVAYGGLQTVTLAHAFAKAGATNRHFASIAWNVSYDTGTAIGATLVGAIAMSYSFQSGFYVMAGIALVWTLVVVLGVRPEKSAPRG